MQHGISGLNCPAEVAVRALTVGEQQRFEAGREIYGNLCVACHQPTGVGGDKLAPSLVGSPMLEGGRRWGNTEEPVDAAVVKVIRDQLTPRTRPWTNEELAALPAAVR